MFCPRCGASNDDNNFRCVQCQSVLQSERKVTVIDGGNSAGMRMLLPVGRSGLAIAAGYAGLFALLVLPAPIALVLGVLAVRDIKQNPHKHGMGRAIFGIVAGTVGTLLLIFAVGATLLGR